MSSLARPVLFVAFLLLFVMQIVICIEGLRIGSDGRADFRHLYTAGYMVRSGHAREIYDYAAVSHFQNALAGSDNVTLPFDHLAYESLLFVPFSFLKYSSAYLLFAGLNVLLLVAAQRMFRPYISGLTSLGRWVPESIFFCFLPAAITIILGQDSILLLTFMVMALLSMDRGHYFQSGLLLALGLFKFQFVVPIALLFLIWRKWRFVAGVLLGSIAAIGVSIWITGASAAREFAETLFSISVGLSNDAQQFKYGTFPNRMPNLRGLISVTGGSYSSGVIHAAIVVASFAVILVVARMKPSFPLAIIVATLVSYHGLIHDAIVLIIPIGVTLIWSISEMKTVAALIAVSVFVAPAVVFVFLGGRYFWIAGLIVALMFVLPGPGTIAACLDQHVGVGQNAV